jgi:preprotein translocase subunit SecB
MTDTSSQQPEQTQDAGSLAVEMPIYGLQLIDVALWQMNIEREESTVQPPPDAHPNVSTNVEISLPDEHEARTAKLSLDFTFPAGQTPLYRLHIELIGLFAKLQPDQEDSQKVQSPVQPGSPKAERQPSRPLDDYTALVLIWPYMREIVHQLQLRMRVALFMLPTLDVAIMQAEKQASEQE